MPMTMPVMAPGGMAGWPVLALGGRLANALLMTNGITAVMQMPMMSPLQEKMSNSARAQRRALREQMPSQTSATASRREMAMPGSRTGWLTGGAFGALAAIICPNSISGTNSPARQPSSNVRMPKTSRPVERSL